MKTVVVSNIEYHALLDLGGDPLIAVFALLRYNKKDIVIKRQGKEAPYALIRSVTGLSRTTIEKYLPAIIDLGLVYFQKNGNVAVRSRNWTRKNLPPQNEYKLIPIEICKNFSDTKISVFWVRVYSNLELQKSQIGRNAERIQQIAAYHRGQSITLYDRNLARKWVKEGVTIESLSGGTRLISTISNLGFSRLYQTTDKNKENPQSYSKSLGNYLKGKLLIRGLITQQRQVKLVLPGNRSRKMVAQLNEALKLDTDVYAFGGFFVGKKGIYLESSPLIYINAAKKVQRKSKLKPRFFTHQNTHARKQ